MLRGMVRQATVPIHRIELRLRDIAQLFNSMDPTPFDHKDLDPRVEEFIESWALEYPTDSRFHINVHVEQLPGGHDVTALVTEAMHNFYDNKAELARRELRQLLAQGRTSLAIGIGFLVSCLLLANASARIVAAGTFLDVVRESFTIGGWVAMWRPLQIFLYEWWPIVRRRRTYVRLAHAHVRVVGRAALAAAGAV